MAFREGGGGIKQDKIILGWLYFRWFVQVILTASGLLCSSCGGNRDVINAGYNNRGVGDINICKLIHI